MKRLALLLIVFLSGIFAVSAFAVSDEEMASSFDCSIRMGIFHMDTFEWEEYTAGSYALNDLKENEDFSFVLLVENKTDNVLSPTVAASVNGKELNWESTDIAGKDTHKFFGSGQITSAGTYNVIYYINGIEVKRASFEIVSGENEPPVSAGPGSINPGDLMKTLTAGHSLTSTPEPTDAGSRPYNPGDLVKTLAAGNDGSSVPGSRVILQNAGDSFSFGRYEQDQKSGADLIEWQVLAIEDGRALVISKYGLEAKGYNRFYENTTWETSSLREWLNGEFFDAAFSADEKSRIEETAVSNPDNQKYGTGGGNDTQDKIFLLSIDEANRYFSENEARACEATYKTEKNGANVNSKTGMTLWWLRSPGEDGNNAAVVYADGSIYDFGLNVDDRSCTVRPSFWLTLSDEGELPVSEEMPGTDPVFTPTRTPEPAERPEPSADDEDLASKFDCEIQMGVYNAETDGWTEYKGSTLDIGDLSPDEGFAFALYIENRTDRVLTPTISAYVNGEEVTWSDTAVSARDYHRYFASDCMGGPGIYNITYYINGVDVKSASFEVTASDEVIAGSFDSRIVMGIYNRQTDDWEEYSGRTYDLSDLGPDESYAFALYVENRMNRAVIPTVTASVNGKELSWDDASIDGNDDHRFFASNQMNNAGTYDVIYYINGIRVQSASFDIVDGDSGFNDLYECRAVMGIYDSDMEEWYEYSGSSYVLSDLKLNESFAFALHIDNKTNKTMTPRVTAVINGERLTWNDMDIKPHGDLSDYAWGYMDKAGTYEVEFFIDGTKVESAVFEIRSSADRSVTGSFDAVFVMGIYDSRTKSWYEYGEESLDRNDLRANEEFSFALKVTNTSADEIEPDVSYLVNEKKQSLPPVKIRPGSSQTFYATDEMTEDGLYDIWFFVNDAEVTHNTVEIQGEWMVDQKGDVGVLLYDKPGYNGNILRSLLNGTMVVKLDTSTAGSVTWANIRTREGQTGWVPESSLVRPR